MAALALLLLTIACYLLGSIPCGVLISKNVYHLDVREYGSGNIGSTNVFRVLGAKGGIACFAGDFAKGFAAGCLAWALAADVEAGGIASTAFGIAPMPVFSHEALTAIALLASVCGHVYNPWLRFKGGKGVATCLGCAFITLGWPWALLGFALFLAVAVATKYVSAGSITGAVFIPIAAAIHYGSFTFPWFMCTATAAIIIHAHRENIKRLAAGSENKFSVKKG